MKRHGIELRRVVDGWEAHAEAQGIAPHAGPGVGMGKGRAGALRHLARMLDRAAELSLPPLAGQMREQAKHAWAWAEEVEP